MVDKTIWQDDYKAKVVMEEQEESFAPVARLDAVGFFVAYAAHMSFPFYQIGRGEKRHFLMRPLKRGGYVAQQEGFVDPDNPEKSLPSEGKLYPQSPEGIFINQAKVRFRNSGKKLNMEIVTPLTLIMSGCIVLAISTLEGIQFLGDKLVSWMSKKQNCTAMSSAEAEYVALSASCAQVMWMRTQLQDYGFNYNKIPLIHSISNTCWNPFKVLKRLQESYANIIVILTEYPSDTYVFTMKMEILLESASNKLLVGSLPVSALSGTMPGVDVDTLTMERYLALSREHQAPGVVKTEIKGNVNFKIKSQFIRELREETFSENKNEDAHDHIDRVHSIVGLFNIPGVSKDVVML
ncbi:hypothetical protein Tco_0634581 [Tanacetum coccineum]